MSKSLNKILVIRFSSLGDIVLTSLLIRCLKKQLGCEIHFITKKSFSSLLEHNPSISKVWSIDSAIKSIIPSLKNEKYDLIIDLHKNIRSMQLRLALWGTPVLSYDKANLQKWAAINLKTKINIRHVALRYLDAVTSKNVHDDGGGLDFFIPPKDQVEVSELKLSSKYIALVIGAAHYTKRVPLIKLQEIIYSIPTPISIVLIGGKAEFEQGEALKNERVINTCGLYNINQSASLLQQSLLVISPDTGMIHIAAALKKPIKSIWGSTLAEYGFWPFYGSNHPDQNHSYEVKNLSCRPCARFGKDHCPKGHFNCMMKQEFGDIGTL